MTPERSRTIEIVDFIDLDEVDPVYYDRPYYLVPLKGGEKAYRLLAEVMRQTNRAGLAKFVLAEREHLVAVRSTEGALMLTTLHYSEDILPDTDFAPTEAKVSAGAKVVMKGAITGMMADFDPEKYADERRKRVMALLERKARETAPVEAPAAGAEEEGGPPDLMAALEEAMRDLRKNR